MDPRSEVKNDWIFQSRLKGILKLKRIAGACTHHYFEYAMMSEPAQQSMKHPVDTVFYNGGESRRGLFVVGFDGQVVSVTPSPRDQKYTL